MNQKADYDVVVLGAGMAGLSLARHLLLDSDKRILNLEKKSEVPGPRQKLGESMVQVAGYYYSKILDLEDYLMRRHFMKYNLRFYWKTKGRDNRDYEDYSQSFIRKFSNIASYQIDRNRFEEDLLDMNNQLDRYTLMTGCQKLEVDLAQDGGFHHLTFEHEGEKRELTAEWVIDTTGQNRFLSRKLAMDRKAEIEHASAYFWVDGAVNVEKLTGKSRREQLLNPARRDLGHLPMWLATNHFVGEGFWLWVIPLHERTSIGLVFDTRKIDPSTVNREDKLRVWLEKEFPIFDHALKDKPFIDFSFLRNFARDHGKTLHPNKWAFSGMSGRFSDPLYSPGSDLIAIHNTLIVDLIKTESDKDRGKKIAAYESLCKIVFLAFIPSFQEGYPPLGEPESFSLKYTWELAIYFAFFVFPFMNQKFTDRQFLAGYFRRFAPMGDMNRTVLRYIEAYMAWKKSRGMALPEPRFFDFLRAETLSRAESTFYEVGLDAKRALAVIDQQVVYLAEYARFIIAHIDSVVVGDPKLVENKEYVDGIQINDRGFDPERIQSDWAAIVSEEVFDWSVPTCTFRRVFHPELQMRMTMAEES